MSDKNWRPLFELFLKHLRINSRDVPSVDPRGAPLNLWTSQQIVLDMIEQGMAEGAHWFMVAKSRQVGCSTIIEALVLFWLAIHNNMIGAYVIDRPENRRVIRQKIEHFINSFPTNFFGKKFNVVKDNDDFIQFSNGSRLDLLVAGTKKKENWGEGRGYALVHASEVSKFGSPAGISNFLQALSEVNPDRLFIFESTSNGMNHWKDMWDEFGRDEFNKRRIFVGWWGKDSQMISRHDPRFAVYGYEPEPKERQLMETVERDYGVRVSIEQLAWYREKQSNVTVTEQDLSQNQPWCVVGSTRVGTDSGILRIDDVKVGLMTSCGKVINAMPTGKAVIWKAKTSLGYEIRGTANHPLIDINNAEVDIKDSLGTIVKLQSPKFADQLYVHKWKEGIIEHHVIITPELSRLVGLFMGDGSMYGSPRSGYEFKITCSGRDRDVADECHRLVRDIFGITCQERIFTPEGPQGGSIEVRVSSKLIYDTFRKMGLVTTDGGYTRRKVHVPEFIFRSPKHVVKEFLSGLFEADGFNDFRDSRIVFSTKYEDFARDVQILLLGFGITSRAKNEITKIKKLGKQYGSVSCSLRKNETIKFNHEIGFLSERKRVRGKQAEGKIKEKKMPGIPLLMQDEIVSVECENVEEEVFNLTIEGNHVFDCNGILTHNTAGQSFVMSGYSFFPQGRLEKEYERCSETPYKGYKYIIGADFWGVECEEILEMERIAEVTLRVWEEPEEDATYVIGVDPAYGRDEFKDRHGISIWRCFGDKLVQVAEWADNIGDTKTCAWVLAHLAGAYKNCVINVESAPGPGGVVINELENLRERMRIDPRFDSNDRQKPHWDDFLFTARWYLYRKPDHFAPGFVKCWESNFKSKAILMNTLRDRFTCDEIVLHSVPLIEEMMSVIRNGDRIGAPDSQKDDRVVSMALACIVWVHDIRLSLLNQGETYEKYVTGEDAIPATTRLVNDIIGAWFKQQEEESEFPKISERQQWLIDRGLE